MQRCLNCNSENIYFSKKRNIYVCEDCGNNFLLEKSFLPQKIFLSYGHDKNEFIVKQIKKDLEARGHFVWIDKKEIKAGQDWRKSIYKGISESNQFLSFLSVYSTRIPGVCLDEIAIAVGIRGCNIKTILLEKDVNAPISISNIQWLDMSDWMIYYEKGGVDWDNWYDYNFKEITKTIENEDNLIFSGEITHLEKKLHPSSFDVKLSFLLSNDFYGREWLMDEVDKWYKENKTTKLFWLLGGPGVGKSAFVARLAHYFSGTAAMQFCEWDKKDSSNPKQIVKTLSFQIATKLNDYRKLLIELVDKEDIDSMALERLFDYLLIEPLNLLIDGGRERQIILIDALDEIAQEYNEEFVQLLARNMDKFPNWVSFIITSRLEASVIEPLRAFKPVILEVDSSKNQTDILLFIKGSLTSYIKDKKKLSEISKIILNKSGGVFLYAKEVISEMKSGNIKAEDIKKLPQGMVGIYWHSFKRMFPEISYYNNFIKPFLKITIAAKEAIPLSVIKTILKISSEELYDITRKLQSFFPQVIEQGLEIVKPFHKSIIEWLTSNTSGKYFIDITDGNETIAHYGLSTFNDEQRMPLYFVKHLITHLKETNKWYSITFFQKQDILESLIAQSLSYGYKYLEYYYITLLDELVGVSNKIIVLSYKLKYYTRTSGKNVIKVANQLLKELNDETNNKLKFNYLLDIAVAYFYVGLHNQGIDILRNIEEKNTELILGSIINTAKLNHTYCLFMHDIDCNKKVVDKSIIANQNFKILGDNYHVMITQVNLFDGLMGIGKLKDAELIAQKTFEESERLNLIHVNDILYICYANLLFTQGKIITAFEYYEQGLQLADIIEHEWDFIYGRIWRELCLAKLGDDVSVDNLLELVKLVDKKGYSYLSALGSTFALLAAHTLKIKLDEKQANDIFWVVRNSQTPGLLAQALAVLILDKYNVKMDLKTLIQLLIETALSCEGVKGDPMIFYEFINKYNLSSFTYNEEFQKWIKNYIMPHIYYCNNLEEETFNDFDKIPLLEEFHCKNCEALCCYDGVYLSEEDEKQIHYAVKTYPQYFKHLPFNYIVDGQWRDKKNGRKTNTRAYDYVKMKIPQHFTKTRCVFAYENGECSLQKAATNNLLNPWKFKPKGCWLFPITLNRDAYSITPPLENNIDALELDEEYPGYVKFLPCGKISNKGLSWYKNFKNEILYFNNIKEKRRKL